MGWLHSRPKVNQKSTETKTRYESMQDGDLLRHLPECDEFIVSAWQKCGLISQSAMGASPLSWQEIKAFSAMSCASLTPFESECISAMSREYLSMRQRASDDVSIPPPFIDEARNEEALAAQRQSVVEGFKAFRKR